MEDKNFVNVIFNIGGEYGVIKLTPDQKRFLDWLNKNDCFRSSVDYTIVDTTDFEII